MKSRPELGGMLPLDLLGHERTVHDGASGHVPCKSDYPRQQRESQKVHKEKKREKSPTFLDDDLDFTNAVLMGLETINNAVLNGSDDVTNPFDFSK